MTIEQQGFEMCLTLLLLLWAIGIPLAMSAGFRDGPRKARPAVVRAAVKKQPHLSGRTKRAKRTKKAWFVAPPLSAFEQRLVDEYFIKRNTVRA